MQEAKKNFFISYNKADITWAEWIAWELEEAGYATTIQAWDFRPGLNFVTMMQERLETADCIIAVLSPDYLNADFTKAEWAVAFGKDPRGEKGFLLPVRVRECEPERMLKGIIYIDLVGFEEEKARAVLLKGVKPERAKPPAKPEFPDASQQQAQSSVFPGALSPVWNVPHQRNLYFIGRDELLADLHDAFNSEREEERCQAIYGLGGIGKTQTAIEYAYRYASEYGVVWWLRSEEPAALAADYASLYRKLELLPSDMTDQDYMNSAVRRWLEVNEGWLLIFDNALSADDVRAYIPHQGRGHVLITSRNSGWREIGTERQLEPLSPEAAVDFLLKRTG